MFVVRFYDYDWRYLISVFDMFYTWTLHALRLEIHAVLILIKTTYY